MALAQQQLSTSVDTVYTSTGSSVVTGLYLVNTSSSAVAVNIYFVPDSQSASLSTVVYYNRTIDSHDTLVLLSERVLLSSGDRIQASCSADLSVTASLVYTLL